MSAVETAKSKLAEFAAKQVGSEYMTGEDMVRMAQAVMDAEAVAHVQALYERVPYDQRVFFLFDYASRSDDTWSGRGNDSKRSAQDAVTRWCTDQMTEIRYAK